MGQVPKNHGPIYGLLGNGKAATHFGHYLVLKNITYVQASRSHLKSLNSGMSFTEYAHQTLAKADVILVLVNDDAIEPLISEIQFKPDQKIVHFSGALTTPLASGWHPLMTFAGKPYELNVYETMGFVGEIGGTKFSTLFPELLNPHIEISREDRARYHAFCVASGNFTNLLWNSFFKEFESRWGKDRSFIMPYLEQVVVQLLKSSPGETRLTGPLARGDQKTMEKNLRALEGHPMHGVYKAFVDAFAPHHLPHNLKKEARPL